MDLHADVYDTSMYNSLKLKTIPSILGNGQRLAQPCDEIHLEMERHCNELKDPGSRARRRGN